MVAKGLKSHTLKHFCKQKF